MGLALGSQKSQGKEPKTSANRDKEASKPKVEASGGTERPQQQKQNSLDSWFDKRRPKEKSRTAPVIQLRGDKKQRVYYWPWCAEYEKMPNQRRVIFKSRKEAEEAGYTLGQSCPDPGSLMFGPRSEVGRLRPLPMKKRISQTRLEF